MKKNLLIAFSGITLLSLATASLILPTKSSNQIVTEDERIQYEKFLNEHEFSQKRYTIEELEKMPKADRPDLAWEQDYLATMNPALGRPEREKLAPILTMTKNMQQAITSTAPGNAGSPWVERGPDNVGGRTRALAWDPTTANKVWAGSVTGGLWYNNNITSNASQWQRVNDFWDNIAVTAIAFDPTNANTMYISTGEGWGNPASRGAGIWKSTNGGTSFNQLASTTDFYYINDLVVRNEGGTGVVYAAVASKYYQGQWHGSSEGLQRSANGGTTWTQELPSVGAGPEAPTDIDIAADNSIWVGVDANSFGQGGGKIYSSTNGTTFTLRHNHGNSGRVNLACAPSDANYIYAAFEFNNAMNAFKQSTNGGAAWTTRSEPNDVDNGIPANDFTRGQAWYDLTLDVDPNSRTTVIIGGIDLFKTTNGGAAWSQISKWSNNNNLSGLAASMVHADQHAVVYRDGSSSDILFGNDGGVFYSNNGNNATPTINSRVNGYNVTQYYACAIHPTAGSNVFLAGAQDNGTQRYTAPGINSTNDVYGGDGAFCHIDQTNGNYQTVSYVYNVFAHSTNNGAFFTDINNDQGSGRFINPSDLDNNQNILYTYRSQTSLYRVTNFQSASPNVGTFNMSNIGADASHLSVSPYTTASTTLFVGTTAGRVFKLTNAQGAEVTTEITGASFPTGSVSCITFGANENEILVTFSNYGVNSVWYTSNGGTSWTSKEGDLPDMPVRWALFNPNDYNEVILATEVGVWTTTGLNAGSPNWTTSNSGLANVRVDMLQMRTSDNEVIAATHGRGLFSSDGFNGPAAFTANFSANNTTPTINQTVTFTDMSATSPTGWTWTFSPATVTYQGGTNANSQNPQVSFDNPGAYTVTLVSTDGTSNDTETKTSYINVANFVADFSANNVTPTTAQTVTFTDATATAATGWTWTFAPATVTYQGGTNANSQNPQVTFDNAGAYTATLVATDGNGNSDTEVKTAYINATVPPATTCHSPVDSLYTMGFEAGEDLTGWATADANGDANTWGIVNISAAPQGALSGTNAAWYNWNNDGTTPGDDWLFTNCFNLVPGVNYTFSFWWSTGDGYNENVEFFGGSAQTVAGMTASLRTLANVQDTTWVQETINFSVNTAGDYYFGWHNTSIANQWYFALEDINLTGVPASITWTNQPANTTISCDASSAPANTGAATATTNCPIATGGGLNITSSDAVAAGACANASTITRTWTATDSCGNSETFDQIITVQDITDPTITCPATQAQTAANGVSTTLNDYTGMATISDNCSSNANITVTQSPAIGSTQNVGNVTVTLTATDECNNTSNCSFTVNITAGTTAITWTNQPGATTISCDASSAPANTGTATATTTCGSGGLAVNFSDATAAGACANASTITRTWTATDNCGNSETYNQVITIQDVTNPTISCPANQSQSTAGTTVSLNDYTGMATVSDNCSSNGNITVTQSPAIGSNQGIGNVTVTLTATDECNNTSSCNFTVNITAGTTAITWTNQPGATTISCDASSAPANTGTATATTTCGSGGLAINFSDATAAGACANASTITRTWTATDNCGNSETYNQVITVQDITDPTITCPATQAQTSTNGTNATLNDYTGMATVGDNCSSNANITITQSPAIGSTQNVGNVTVTLTATDECNNTSSCNFTVNILAVPSTITWTNQPTNVTIDCDASSLPANTGTATATTTCGTGGLNITSADATVAGACANESVITRTWTATDNCGNSETFDQIITIEDNTDPVITCPANQTQLAANGTDTVLIDYTSMATISDNCSSNANITVTQSPAIGSTQAVGTINVTLTATDECGNTANCNFDVEITNTTNIADNTRVNVSIFPNPNKGLFTIDLGTEMNGNVTIQVYNLLGEIVYNEEKENSNTSYHLDLQHVEKGIYYVSVKGAEKSIVKKIMIM